MQLLRSKHDLDWHRSKQHCTSWSERLSGQPSSFAHQQRVLFGIAARPKRQQGPVQAVPQSWYNWRRGDITKHMGLRLQIKAPASVKADNGNLLTVSDISDPNTLFYIQYGAQFAD